jgi:hypothetical protein
MALGYDLPTCSFCNRPVQIETSKTDEHGRAIHEECSVIQITGKKRLALLNSFFIVPTSPPMIRKKAQSDRSVTQPAGTTFHQQP